jgi:hypothetical protein
MRGVCGRIGGSKAPPEVVGGGGLGARFAPATSVVGRTSARRGPNRA